jgi:hypothetical protein
VTRPHAAELARAPAPSPDSGRPEGVAQDDAPARALRRRPARKARGPGRAMARARTAAPRAQRRKGRKSEAQRRPKEDRRRWRIGRRGEEERGCKSIEVKS